MCDHKKHNPISRTLRKKNRKEKECYHILSKIKTCTVRKSNKKRKEKEASTK